MSADDEPQRTEKLRDDTLAQMIRVDLAAGGVTDEDILLRRRELATSFRYFMSMGFSYTFGSRFANVVNPRFGI